MNVVSEDPHICYYDNFITDEECDFIVNVSKDHMKRAGVSDPTIDRNIYKGRTNESYWIPLNKYDTVFICVPDDQKLKTKEFCIEKKKPLFFEFLRMM